MIVLLVRILENPTPADLSAAAGSTAKAETVPLSAGTLVTAGSAVAKRIGKN